MDDVDKLCKLLGEADVTLVFWVCPNDCNGQVSWEFLNNISISTCEVCGATEIRDIPPRKIEHNLEGETIEIIPKTPEEL